MKLDICRSNVINVAGTSVGVSIAGFAAFVAFWPEFGTAALITTLVFISLCLSVVFAHGRAELRQLRESQRELSVKLIEAGFEESKRVASGDSQRGENCFLTYTHQDGRAFFYTARFSKKGDITESILYRLHYDADKIPIEIGDVDSVLALYDPSGNYPLVS